jgi:hypothetical protein
MVCVIISDAFAKNFSSTANPYFGLDARAISMIEKIDKNNKNSQFHNQEFLTALALEKQDYFFFLATFFAFLATFLTAFLTAFLATFFFFATIVGIN